MIKISCYKTKLDQLSKTFCQLAAKCYSASINTCAITNNSDFTIELDRVLWIYSRKQFIPHATNKDPLPEKQPIYITDSIENPNNSKIFILINLSEENLFKFCTTYSKNNIESIEKIIILFNDNHNVQYSEINSILLKSKFDNFEISLFEQENNGNWQSIQ